MLKAADKLRWMIDAYRPFQRGRHRRCTSPPWSKIISRIDRIRIAAAASCRPRQSTAENRLQPASRNPWRQPQGLQQLSKLPPNVESGNVGTAREAAGGDRRGQDTAEACCSRRTSHAKLRGRHQHPRRRRRARQADDPGRRTGPLPQSIAANRSARKTRPSSTPSRPASTR